MGSESGSKVILVIGAVTPSRELLMEHFRGVSFVEAIHYDDLPKREQEPYIIVDDYIDQLPKPADSRKKEPHYRQLERKKRGGKKW